MGRVSNKDNQYTPAVASTVFSLSEL